MGPHESYPDRSHSTRIGHYRSTVADTVYPFILPQESGGHEGTRWFAISDEQGHKTARVECHTPLHFSARPYSRQQLTEKTHYFQLQPENKTFVTVDAAHLGVGGDNGWMLNVHEPYLVKPSTYRYTFTLKFS